jgi:hypothetical protein
VQDGCSGAAAAHSDASLSWCAHARKSNYISWSTLLARTFGLDPLVCSKCQGTLRPIAVIARAEIVARILSHLRLPPLSGTLSDGYSIVFDVSDQPIPDWLVATDPEPDERGPPEDCDFIDPPAPED